MNAITTKHRYLGYAYPSSDIATKLGHSKTGCYYVNIVEVLDRNLPCESETVFSSANEIEALEHFKTLDMPTFRYSMVQ